MLQTIEVFGQYVYRHDHIHKTISVYIDVNIKSTYLCKFTSNS